ncbi:MAG: flagellar hook-associated protein FlgK [Polyangiaceae bacterium]|nr:flagellar hook-associated protein FlgK [Polyangiaceae bacterium]
MRGLGGLLDVARSGLTAQTGGVNASAQNVANANTPGYARRTALLEARALGGVDLAAIRRTSTAWVEQRLAEASGQESRASRHDLELARLEPLFSPTGPSVGTDLERMFAAFGEVASNPSDPTARSLALTRGSEVASRFREVADGIAARRQELLEEAKTLAETASDLAEELAKVSSEIAKVEAAGGDAGGLRDQQARALSDLSQIVDVQTFENSNGELVVRAAGTTLVEGGVARTMAADLDGSGDLRLTVSSGSSLPADATASLSGGRLAAIRDARDGDLEEIAGDLDQLAFDLASAVNAQHAAGYGADGGTGRAFFDAGATVDGAARALQLSSDVAGQPDRVAAAELATSGPGDGENARRLAALADAAFAAGGQRTGSEEWGRIVGDVGRRKAATAADLETRTAMREQADALRQSESGVSLDEEMVSLMRYQRAYEASAQVLRTADELLAEVVSRFGR